MKSFSRNNLDAALDSVILQMEYLQEVTNSAEIALSPHEFELLTIYARQIIIWNKKVRLISLGDVSRIAIRHLYESLLLTKVADLSGSKRILDIGTGAGLPGIPLKIWNPNLELTLLESQRKKVIFLDLVSEILGLEQVQIICARAEEAAKDSSLRGTFDVVIARAVAPLSQLLEWAEPFLNNNSQRKGMCIFPKGSNVNEELIDVNKDKWTISTVNLSPVLINNKQPLVVVTAVLTNI